MCSVEVKKFQIRYRRKSRVKTLLGDKMLGQDKMQRGNELYPTSERSSVDTTVYSQSRSNVYDDSLNTGWQMPL